MRAMRTIAVALAVVALVSAGCSRRQRNLGGGGSLAECPSPCAPPIAETPCEPPAPVCVLPPPPCVEPVAPAPCAPPPPPVACAPVAPAPCAPCAPETPIATRVLPGDLLRGHLSGQGCQCFYFDGVEYALLDFTVKTDIRKGTAPKLTITDPDGQPVDLSGGLGPEGTTCQRAHGIVLRKTGTYRGLVCKTSCEEDTFYTVQFDLRTLSPDDEKVHLTPCTTKTVSFVASRGSRILMTVRPEGRCGVVPKYLSVTDPHGGRALAPERALPGAPVPVVREGRIGEQILDFNAAIPGRYTVTYTAEKDTEGDATTIVQIFPPKPSFRRLYHDNHACPEPGVLPTSAAMPPEPSPR
jgi:hypothetical protein